MKIWKLRKSELILARKMVEGTDLGHEYAMESGKLSEASACVFSEYKEEIGINGLNSENARNIRKLMLAIDEQKMSLNSDFDETDMEDIVCL
jgi:hypothetical protein